MTLQQGVGKPEDISLADMVGQPPTPWVDRRLGVADDRRCTLLMMMYIIAFILIRGSEAVTAGSGRSQIPS